MQTDLPRLIRDLESEILRTWAARVESATHGLHGSPDELRESCRRALESVIGLLEGGEPAPVPLRAPVVLAAQAAAPSAAAARAAVHDTACPMFEPVSSDVLAVLEGREAVFAAVLPYVPASEKDAVSDALADAFARIASQHGHGYCALCRSRQERSRESLERHLESVVQHSPDAIVLFDDSRVVRGWNPGAEALFGFTRDEVLGRSLDVLVPERLLRDGDIRRLMRTLRDAGHARMPETERRRKTGETVWVDASYTVVHDAEGRSLGTWAIFRDVTDRRRLEEAKMQSERLALIGTMAAKLAHEVRNPLTSIMLNLDLIRDGLTEDGRADGASIQESQELLASTESEVQRIQEVVEDYLRFARLPRLRLEPTDLDGLLRRHLEMVAPELLQRHVETVLDLEAGEAMIATDENQIWQAVLNLVRNAMEAMPEGGTLTIATAVQDGRLECRIADTGSGMSPEVMANMFRPFYSTKRGGTGLGMPLTQQIIQEHGAALHCDSAPGQGTRFTIVFPTVAPHRSGARMRQRAQTA